MKFIQNIKKKLEFKKNIKKEVFYAKEKALKTFNIELLKILEKNWVDKEKSFKELDLYTQVHMNWFSLWEIEDIIKKLIKNK